MKTTIFLIFLCTAFEGKIGDHIFVPTSMTWLEAQSFCVHNYTDLSFVSSQRDHDNLLSASAGYDPVGWIGLQRDPNNKTAWKWSGGGHITFQNWGTGQPDNFENREENAHILSNGKWNDENGAAPLPFYCISLIALGPRKTWEGALRHCKNRETHLTSLLSETDRLLAQKVFQKVHITERVWIGLRFLQDHWLWVNGDPLVYQAWAQGGDQDHQCPIWKRCGVLTKEGQWESWDCGEKLNFICY